jgi:predicted DNA-binding transcriptional regulator YafY
LEQRIKDGFGGFIASKGATQYEFVFHFDQKVSHRVSEMKWHHSQQERLLDDGRIEIRFNTSGLEGVLRWILAWGDQVTVMAPDELKDRIRQELAGMLRRY